ncbi:MAG: glycine cleavage system protein T [Syntrophus sp. (in: bacteria)]|nr:glycine cleavage system protein T [Syntrophus sp. (in: bacteria)]
MKKTPLYERHLALGARMIDFGGWLMPVQYTNVIDEHHATRTHAGLFDICHMGEIAVKGAQAFALLQRAVSRNLEKQAIGQMKLCVLTNEQGGIIDDLTVYRLEDDHYMLVTNAACTDRDLQCLQALKESEGFSGVEIIDRTVELGKLDIQGPQAQAILQSLAEVDLAPLKYYHCLNMIVAGIESLVSRSGYTGEDGFEIYTDAGLIGDVWDRLLAAGAGAGLKPVGLGARDTLRLEAGMMLYGHEMNESVSPFEVTYGWIVDLEKDFIGRDTLIRQKKTGVSRKMVGFEMADRGIARQGYKILKYGREIGEVTSGTLAPTLNKAVGLAFVPTVYTEPGTEIDILIRERPARAKVVKLPFYKRTDKHIFYNVFI